MTSHITQKYVFKVCAPSVRVNSVSNGIATGYT